MSPPAKAGQAVRAAFTHPGVRRVLRADGTVARVYASRAATEAWARRDGARWPGSTLAGVAIRADFEASGDLVDLAFNGGRLATDSPRVDGHEAGALLDDLRGPRGHRWAVGAKPAKPASRYAYRVVDHYGNAQVVDRATRDERAAKGRVADWRRVRVPLAWAPSPASPLPKACPKCGAVGAKLLPPGYPGDLWDCASCGHEWNGPAAQPAKGA